MQPVNAALQAELDKGQVDPIQLIDLYEFYANDYTPGVNGFNPADAIETFAAEEITWNGIAYRREVISRGDGSKAMGEKTNSIILTFSNISRYMATLAQSQEIEGLFVVIRTVRSTVTTDSLVLFTGRAEKPSDIDKKTFTLAVRQDFGNINQTVPPRRFENFDPEGRIPSDPLYEGIDLVAIAGSLTFPRVEPSTSFFGRLFGRRRTVFITEPWSSLNSTPFGQVIPEIFGRSQVALIPIAWADKGSHVGYLMVVGNGRLDAVTNLKSRTEGMHDPICSFANPPAPAVVHLGDPGGTGTNNGNTCQADLAGGRFFSNLAYIEGASTGVDANGNIVALGLDVADTVPEITAIVRGKRIPLRNASGVYGASGWTDNPVDILRFLLTDPGFVNIDPAFMEDAVFHREAQYCDFPLVDDTNTQVIVVSNTDLPQAGVTFTRYPSTGLLTPRWFLYHRLGDTSIIPELDDGPYIGIDPGDQPDPSDPTDPTYISQKPLRKRFTANFPITEEVRAVDLIYKTLNPAAKLFLRVNKYGKYEPRVEKPADSTRLRTATTVGATSINVLDVTPWKSGPELLMGRILLGVHLTTSEVRTPSAAAYSADGNSITLAASKTGSVTVTASGANLTGGSSTVQASGTITIGGTPVAGDTVTGTINGIGVTYVVQSNETTGTVAAMLANYINANQRLNKYILAVWDSASPTVITIRALYGTLTVPALLKAHDTAVADPASFTSYAYGGGGSLDLGNYNLAYADETADGGLTALTPIATVNVAGNNGLITASTLPAFPSRVVARNFYMSEKANSTNLKFKERRINTSNFNITTVPDNGAAIPPSHNTTAEEMIRVAMSFATNSQDVYPAWTASTAVILNDIYLPTTLNGHLYKVTTAGTTGTTEPSWPTGAGATVASGTAIFTEFGSTVLQQAGLSRANVLKDTFKWPLGGRQSSVNQVKGYFIDSKNDFARTPFRINDPVHQAQVKKQYPMDVDLTAVDNENQMLRLGNFFLSKHREGDWFVSLGTGPAGLVLEEGDVICVSDDSGGLINVPVRIEDLRIRPNHDVIINQARKYSTQMYSDDVGAHRIPIPSNLKFSQTKDSIAKFIDNFPVREQDARQIGFYLAITHDLDESGDWRGYTVWADYGDGYVQIFKGDVAATSGTCTTTLATVTDTTVWDDTNSVTFSLDYAASVPFQTITKEELLFNANRNLFLIGDEYVQAATITDNGNRSYTIRTLLRGRYGTDNDQLSHVASERAVLMDGAAQVIPISPSYLNKAIDYKVTTTNQDLADATAQSFTWMGGTADCLSPVNFRGARDAANNLFATWQRRDRIGQFLKDLAGLPMSEEEEIYQLEVMNGANVVRGPLTIRRTDVFPLLWTGNSLASINGNSITHTTGTSGVSATGTAMQKFEPISDNRLPQNEPLFEAVLAGDTSNSQSTGFIHFLRSGLGVAGYQIDWAGSLTTPVINVRRIDRTALTESSTLVATTSWTNGDRIRVTRTQDGFWFTKNPFGNATSPFYRGPDVLDDVSTFDITVILSWISGTSVALNNAMIRTGKAGFSYPATHQTADGLTPGNAVSLRIGQVSAVVGVGDTRTESV